MVIYALKAIIPKVLEQFDPQHDYDEDIANYIYKSPEMQSAENVYLDLELKSVDHEIQQIKYFLTCHGQEVQAVEDDLNRLNGELNKLRSPFDLKLHNNLAEKYRLDADLWRAETGSYSGIFKERKKLKAIDEVVEKQKDNKYERSEISKEMTKVIDPIYSQIKELTEQSKKLFDQHDKPFHEVLESDLKEFLKAKEFLKKQIEIRRPKSQTQSYSRGRG